MYTLEFELKGLPTTTNGSHGHWATKAKAKRKWIDAVMNYVVQNKAHPSEPLTKAKLTLTRCSSSETDFDNLVISFKPVVDGLKHAGVIVDDKMSVIGQPTYAWESVKRNAGKIRIKVEAV